MKGYLDLLRRPGAGVPWTSAFLARIVLGMAIVSLVLLLRRNGYDYGVAGAAAALHSVGSALGMPMWGRLVDRRGPVALLRTLGVGYGLAMTGVAVAATGGAPVAAIHAVAMVAGFSFPPVSAVARVGWRRLYGHALRDRAFALDGVSVETGFVIGPILAAGLVEGVGSWAGTVVAGWTMTVAALVFTTAPLVRDMTGSPRTMRGGALRVPAVRVLMGTFSLVAIAFGAIDILSPAVAEAAGRDHLAGVLLGAFALGSATGGFVYGSRPWPSTRVNRLQVMTLAMTVAFAALAPLVDRIWAFAAVAMVAGLVIAPIMVIVFGLVDDLAPASVVTEALAWVNTAIVLGAAMGSAVAGQVVERFGLVETVLAGASGLALSALMVAATRRTLAVDGPRVHASVGAGVGER